MLFQYKRRTPGLYGNTVQGFVFVHMDLSLLLPIGIAAYANCNCKIPFLFIKQKFILIECQSSMKSDKDKIQKYVPFYLPKEILSTKYIV